MANPIKQLLGETSIYGLSSILARVLNFMFVPIYTRMLTTAQYGVVTEFMAYIAILQVVLVLGLETGCFRFANKEGADQAKVYSNAMLAVFGLNLAFLAVIVGFRSGIAAALGYDGYGAMVAYVAGILFCDSLTAILFAKLRQDHKATKFAVFKTIKILTETGANLLLFFLYPAFAAAHPANPLSGLISATPDFNYPIFAIFVSCIVCFLLFLPDIVKFRFSFDKGVMGKMLLYSLPLMVAALPGVANDFLDRVLFRYFDTSSEVWQSSLGVYQAAVKLAVIMNLFVQMYRYAAEPFFFQRDRDKGSNELYAEVLEYFTAFCGLVLLGVVGYIDIISLLLGRDFRVGVAVVPVMLLSYMLLGMLFNVSMWYKLSGKTHMAIWITLAGLLVTIVVNVIFMPRFSYWASAFAHLASYVVMFTLCAVLGSKYYPIPYKWGRILLIFVFMGACYGLMVAADALIGGGSGSADGVSSGAASAAVAAADVAASGAVDAAGAAASGAVDAAGAAASGAVDAADVAASGAVDAGLVSGGVATSGATLSRGGMWLRMGLNTLAIFAYLACCWLLLGRSLMRSLKRTDA